MDFIIKLLTFKELKTRIKYDNILIVVDWFNKYVYFVSF